MAGVLARRGRPRKRVDEHGEWLVIAQGLDLSVKAAQQWSRALWSRMMAEAAAGSPIAPLEDWQPVATVAHRWRKSKQALYKAANAGLLKTRTVNGVLELDALARPASLVCPAAFSFLAEDSRA